jgi:predicted ATPase
MKLDKIEVKGFKSIKEMTLKLRPLNILIGANGAGKSNFIALFHLINNIIQKDLQVFVGKSGGIDSLLHFGQKTTTELFVKLYFGYNAYEFTLIPTQKNTLIFSNEACFFHDKEHYNTPYRENIGSGHEEARLLEEVKTDRISKYVLKAIKNWKVYHFHDTSDSAKIKQECNINDNANLKPDASNLAAYLLLLKEQYPQNYKNIVDAICMVAPFFEDFILRPNPRNKENIQLEWKEKGADTYFNAHSLSDGTLRFICLATLLLQPDEQLPSTLLIDEPELGLHPYAINVLADMLESVTASKKHQVVISTQSVTLVNQFEPKDIIVVDMDNKGQSTFNHLEEKDMQNWLEEYGLGDLWEKNILGGRPS